MGSDDRLADEGNGDTNGAEEERLLAANAIEEKDDEEEVKHGTDDVVDASNEEVAIADNTEVLVENGGVVTDNVDTERMSVNPDR